jgi:phosphoribosylglycinamide formyltransferase 1
MPSAIKPRLAIFASGGGSNADKICSYFEKHPTIVVAAIFTNNPKAGVIQVAQKHHVDCLTISKNDWKMADQVLPSLESHHITHIILAGFLLLIPEWLIEAYPDRIVNIHPALLPKYGGKGMYGHNVHEAVKKAGDKESGITIHIVDEHYDKGDILFQHRVDLEPDDNPEQIAAKVLGAEHYYYPRVIEKWVRNEAFRP